MPAQPIFERNEAARLYRPLARVIIYPSFWVAAALASLVVFVRQVLRSLDCGWYDFLRTGGSSIL